MRVITAEVVFKRRIRRGGKNLYFARNEALRGAGRATIGLRGKQQQFRYVCGRLLSYLGRWCGLLRNRRTSIDDTDDCQAQ
jgi:hypothetical protein